MRLSLEPNGEEFARQVKALRKHFDSQHIKGGQPAVSARMMVPAFLPYLTALRTELRDEVVPVEVMGGAADLIANLALTTVQTMFEADEPVQGQIVEELLMKACAIACQSLVQEVEAKKPKLSIVPPPAEGGTVIHMNGRPVMEPVPKKPKGE